MVEVLVARPCVIGRDGICHVTVLSPRMPPWRGVSPNSDVAYLVCSSHASHTPLQISQAEKQVHGSALLATDKDTYVVLLSPDDHRPARIEPPVAPGPLSTHTHQSPIAPTRSLDSSPEE